MSTMITEVYEAFKDAGTSEEKAKAAATALADYEARFNKIDTDLLILKWMLGIVIAAEVLPWLKTIFT